MDDPPHPAKRRKRPPKPLDSGRLEELALAYVARFATSAAKLESYLKRKLGERGWEGEGEPPVKTLVDRYVARGYVDDAGYARARAGSLRRRGYGPRRVNEALGAAGIDEQIREDVRGNEGEIRRAALAMGRRRRFGPFGTERPDRERREKQIAAMLRAGHGFDAARAIVDGETIEAVEAWVAEAEEEDA